MVTARMKPDNKDSPIIRRLSRANRHAARLYSVLNFKQSTLAMMGKSVVPH
jgi:hypothetical protein